MRALKRKENVIERGREGERERGREGERERGREGERERGREGESLAHENCEKDRKNIQTFHFEFKVRF
jgi:hypothetical protein